MTRRLTGRSTAGAGVGARSSDRTLVSRTIIRERPAHRGSARAGRSRARRRRARRPFAGSSRPDCPAFGCLRTAWSAGCRAPPPTPRLCASRPPRAISESPPPMSYPRAAPRPWATWSAWASRIWRLWGLREGGGGGGGLAPEAVISCDNRHRPIWGGLRTCCQPGENGPKHRRQPQRHLGGCEYSPTLQAHVIRLIVALKYF